MLRTVYLIILFKKFNLLASHRARIVSDIWSCLVWDEGIHARLSWIGNWHIWRLLRLLRLPLNVLLRYSLLSLLTLEHLHDLIQLLFHFRNSSILLLDPDLVRLHFCLKISDAVVTTSILLGDLLQALGALDQYPGASVKVLTILRSQELVCASFSSALDLDVEALGLKMRFKFLIGNGADLAPVYWAALELGIVQKLSEDPV
jgi:hypothetical protein